MAEHRYTTLDEQIAKLQKQGLIIEDINTAKACLEMYGYYNVINGYRTPFLNIDEEGNKVYKEGTTFKQVFDLFIFDKTVRAGVMSAVSSVEENFKSVLADIIAAHYGINHNEYLKFTNYKDLPRRYKTRYTLQDVLNEFNKTISGKLKPPAMHYKSIYGYIPPWVLFKTVTFGNVVNLSKYLKSEMKNELVEKMFIPKFVENYCRDIKGFLNDSFALCLEYRNLAAHGGRVYNHNSKKKVHEPTFKEEKGVWLLLAVLSTFKCQDAFRILKNTLDNAINIYCSAHPNDKELLERCSNIPIETVIKELPSKGFFKRAIIKLLHKLTE